MGNPLHYSLELPLRCIQLIDGLLPAAKKIKQRDRPDLGSLTTTFLISMSTPILNLPIERIERHKGERLPNYADDRHINSAVTEEVLTTLGGHPLSLAPFYFNAAWSYAEYNSAINIADAIPDDLAKELADKNSFQRADQMPTSKWCSILRNSLAHGGVAFLDKSGKTSFGNPVSMYVFVSGRYDEAEKQRLIGVNALRISEKNYLKFLRLWVEWLRSKDLGNLAA